MRAFASWLGRQFPRGLSRRSPASPPPASPSVAHAVAPAPVAAAAPVRPAVEEAPPAPSVPFFAEFSRLANLPAHPYYSPTAGELERDALLEAQVLEHYFQNRPAPHSFPGLSLRIINLLANPRLQIGDLSRLIRQDSALTSQLIRSANTAAYAGMNTIESVHDAAVRLGLEQVSKLAAMVSSRSLFSPGARSEFATFGDRWNLLFHEAATLSWAASWMAGTIKGGQAEPAFLGGMMVEVGKSLALRSCAALVTQKKLNVRTEGDRIERVLEKVHIRIGLDAARTWGLPESLQTLIELHHEGELPDEPELVNVHIVRLVSALLHLRNAPDIHPEAEQEVTNSAAALKMSPVALRAAETHIRGISTQLSSNFGVAPT